MNETERDLYDPAAQERLMAAQRKVLAYIAGEVAMSEAWYHAEDDPDLAAVWQSIADGTSGIVFVDPPCPRCQRVGVVYYVTPNSVYPAACECTP